MSSAVLDTISKEEPRTSSPTLEAAERLLSFSEIHPEDIKRRAIRLSCILVFGCVVSIISLTAIANDWATNEQSKVLTMFFLLGGLAVTFTTLVGIATLLWSVIIYQHLEILDVKSKLDEEIHETWEQAVAMGKVTMGLSSEPDFSLKATLLVAHSIEQEMKNGAMPIKNFNLSKEEVKEIASRPTYKAYMARGMRRILRKSISKKDPNLAHFIEEIPQTTKSEKVMAMA